MKLIYTNEDPVMTGYIKNVLEDSGIEVMMKNEYSSGGHAPPYNLWPEIWVVREADYERAETIVNALSDRDSVDQ